MDSPLFSTPKSDAYKDLDAAQLRQLLLQKDGQEARFTELLAHQENELTTRLKQQDNYIQILEEKLRLSLIQRFAAKSEKMGFQKDLFDEVELEVALNELTDLLPNEEEPAELGASQCQHKSKRKRGLSPKLKRERVDLLLDEKDKAGAIRTFFTKVKEELDYIPAQLRVLEYWQEKAVFSSNRKEEGVDTATLVAARRPAHPLGKCQVSVSLLAQIITSKYADGLPLYRQESMFKRYGADINRSSMANWMIRLGDDGLKPLIHLMREHQNSGDYVQGDETRIQVLKEDGKTAQSTKWMWITRGGPPGQAVVLFEYDPTRSGKVPARLLGDFNGIFQTDGYSGYAAVCRQSGITRIGCWDHARRKFVDAMKAAGGSKSSTHSNHKSAKADVALGMIRQLYRIESTIKDKSIADKYLVRQELSVPLLNKLKAWLEKQSSRVMKGSLTRQAMDYCLNQWEYLIGYCQRGDLNISNALAENAIRPFAVGRKAWLFADTSHGARASATFYSLIETAKANKLDPNAYIRYLLAHIGEADTLEKWEALLPWNVSFEKVS